jgi:hypothetical protein
MEKKNRIADFAISLFEWRTKETDRVRLFKWAREFIVDHLKNLNDLERFTAFRAILGDTTVCGQHGIITGLFYRFPVLMKRRVEEANLPFDNTDSRWR